MKTEEKVVRSKSAGIKVKRILVPTDFSPLSKKALHYASRFAQEFRAEMILLHVIEPEIPPIFEGSVIAPPIVTNGKHTKSANRLRKLANAMAVPGTNRVESI